MALLLNMTLIEQLCHLQYLIKLYLDVNSTLHYDSKNQVINLVTLSSVRKSSFVISVEKQGKA